MISPAVDNGSGVIVSGTTQTQYDQDGKVVATISRLQTNYDFGGANPRTITSTYDPLNRLGAMTENGRTSGYGYDLNGNIVKKTLPNGDTETVTFDALNRDTEQTAVSGASTALYDYHYTFDLAGNVTNIAETYPGGINNRTVTNTYDAIYRLLSEADTVSGTTSTTGYTYDAANNRLSKSATGVTHFFLIVLLAELWS